EILKLARVHTVIIGLTWGHDHSGDLVDNSGRAITRGTEQALIAALDDLFDRLHRAGKRTVLIGPIAEPGWNVASIVSRQLAFGYPPDRPMFLPRAEFERRFGIAIEHFATRGDIGFARPDKVQCPAERCYYVLDGSSLFADSNHI